MEAGGRLGVGDGRGGSNRVARLGSALDDVETRSDGPRGRSGRGVGFRSEDKVCTVRCTIYSVIGRTVCSFAIICCVVQLRYL